MTTPMPYPPATDDEGTVTVFVPLTTTFTAAPSCSTLFRQNGPSLVAYDPGYGLDIDTRAGGGKCAPGAVTTWWEQARLGFNDDDGHHTAASLEPLTCPDGWLTLASSQKDAQSTVAMCCPSGYTLANGLKGSIKGDCRSTVARGDVLTYAMTAYSGPSSWKMTTTTLTTGSFIGAIAVVGWNIFGREGETTTGAPAATGTDWRQSQGLPAAPTVTGGSPRATLPQLPGSYDLPLPSTTGSQEGQDQGGQQEYSAVGNSSPSSSSSSSSSSSQDKDNDSTKTIGVSVGGEPGRHSTGAGSGVAGSAAAATQVAWPKRRKRGIGRPDPPPASEQQQSTWWAELPASLGRSRKDPRTKRRPSELPGAPYQRAMAELDGGWQR
ncbi:hypothetical protein PG993_000564 [Apiospora rasikravindrae]|uniref:Uncharacterized protein n=1 Tax=Apiospora rasikravindrae TaxID=990691 RepID=A0ABR1U8X2_9PEZI